MRIQVLGRVRIHATTTVAPPPSTACVLAVLALNVTRPMTVSALVNHQWSQAEQTDSSADTVRDYLRRLRSAIRRSGGDPDCLHNEHGTDTWTLQLHQSGVDYHHFRDVAAAARQQRDADLFREALELWPEQVRPLTGIAKSRWVEHRREELAAERRDVHLDLLDLWLAAGEYAKVVDALATVLDHITPTDRILLLGAVALARDGRHTGIPTWIERVSDRMHNTVGVYPSPGALQDTHRLIADPHWAPPPTTQKAVPRQLPPAPQHFVGRAAELAQLTAQLDTTAEGGGTVLISALAGAGGIGKTWLALQWANHAADRFPDGQLFVDLHGFSPTGTPVDPDTAVWGFLTALGIIPDKMPADLEARAALYRSLVTDRRMLVLLDNAATTDQITPLLPGGRTCTVLVTSRNTLDPLISRHGAHHLHLHPLTPGEARALLTDRLGRHRIEAESDAVADLIDGCRGFALALGLIAGHAHRHPHVPLAQHAAELHEFGLDALDDDDPKASLRSVLSWSYQALTREQQTMFGLLGIAPGPDIAPSATASLTGLAPAHARRILQGLEEVSLLDRDPRDRYSMHDFTRTYATEAAHNHLDNSTRTAALRRILDFYTHTAYAADRLLAPHRQPIQPDSPAPDTHPHPLPDAPAAIAWFDIEHANLLAAQHTATTHAQHRNVWHLARNLTTFQRQRGHRHDQLTVWRAALDATAHLPDRTIRTVTHRRLGHAYVDLNRLDQAMEHLQQALALAQHRHNTTQQAHTHRELAWAWEEQGDDQRALDHSAQALRLYRTLNQPVWEAQALSDVGWDAARLGDYDAARAHCHAALSLHRQHNNPTGEAAALDSLGYIDHHIGHHHQAIDYYRQALTLRRQSGNLVQYANTLDAFGHPHVALGQREQARAVWREALELYREQGRDNDADRVQQQLDNLG